MASIFGHGVAAAAIASSFSISKKYKVRLIVLAVLSSMVPDVDVLAFAAGIPYYHPFGHRGFTHSFFFAIVWAIAIRWTFFHRTPRSSRQGWIIWLILFLSTLSHSLLDALTTGGLGVAFFWPIDHTRYFFPDDLRVIRVSPMSVTRFFTSRGWEVLMSEAVWIGIPSLLLLSLAHMKRRTKQR